MAAAVATFAAAGTQLGRAQQADVKTAEQVYKNITQLKGTPADQLIPAMQFMAGALGVNCEFCHVEGKRDLDDKPAKKRARDMIAMTEAVNKDGFKGRQTVTCYSCHGGAERPVGVPPVVTSDLPPHPETPSGSPRGTVMDEAAGAAIVDQIAAKYLDAAGGGDGLKKITARVMTGSLIAGGNQTPVEIYAKANDKVVVISHAQNGMSYTASDGTLGWTGNTGRPARDMSSQEAWATSVQYDVALPLRLKQLFPQLRPGGPEQVNGVDCVVLNGTAPGKPSARLWFDPKTGLLARMLFLADSPVGRVPTQVDFSDYRDVDGVKMPFRWTTSGMTRRSTIQLTDIQSNSPIDDAKFAKPADAIQ
jgi:Photosynthetic reaction centre cytochrome C subunit.